MGTSKLSGKPDAMLGGYLRWTSIPSIHNTPSRFMLWKPRSAPAVMRVWIGVGGGGGGTNVSCLLKFRPFVSCRLIDC